METLRFNRFPSKVPASAAGVLGDPCHAAMREPRVKCHTLNGREWQKLRELRDVTKRSSSGRTEKHTHVSKQYEVPPLEIVQTWVLYSGGVQ